MGLATSGNEVGDDSPGLLDMADQVKYIMYNVITDDCKRPDLLFAEKWSEVYLDIITEIGGT